MLIFIDEAGDPGLKIGGGSSPVFCIALILFENAEDADFADQRISALRQELGINKLAEFRFNGSNRELRTRFLKAVASCRFLYHGIVIDKAKLLGQEFRLKESFYSYACRLVFQDAKASLLDATAVIDGSGSREFRKELQAYLKKHVNDANGPRLIKKIKVQDSKSNNLLQLADRVAGSIYRRFGAKDDAEVYRRLIIEHEMEVRVWPA